jgi:type IV pilus assembly protein PilB
MALFEILGMDDDMRDMVMTEASLTALRHQARSKGMRSLRESGLMAMYEGLTTIDEVVRETLAEEE